MITIRFRFIRLVFISLVLLTGCTAPSGLPSATELSPETPTGGTPSPTTSTSRVEATLKAAGVIETRVPVPTATPGAISKAVDISVRSIGLEDVAFMGLSSSDWANLIISLLLVLGGYLLGTVISRLSRSRIAPRLSTESAQASLIQAGNSLRWLITLLAAELAVGRLSFVGANIKAWLRVIEMVTTVLLVARILWSLIDIIDAEAHSRIQDHQREVELEPAFMLVRRLARVTLIVISVATILSILGINLTAFAALLGIGGLAFSLAARSSVEDGIAGVIILLDRPFRVGDRIEVQAANTWGDVTDIGLRTTRVRTRDNRMVIIPNSVIVSNEIINYSYPDPTYRIETEISIDYDTDLDHVKEVLETAVRGVPYVLDNHPVDILYDRMTDVAIIMRVRWWIQSYADTRRVIDKINTAIHKALEDAQIVVPFPTQNVLVRQVNEDDPPESRMTG